MINNTHLCTHTHFIISSRCKILMMQVPYLTVWCGGIMAIKSSRSSLPAASYSTSNNNSWQLLHTQEPLWPSIYNMVPAKLLRISNNFQAHERKPAKRCTASVRTWDNYTAQEGSDLHSLASHLMATNEPLVFHQIFYDITRSAETCTVHWRLSKWLHVSTHNNMIKTVNKIYVWWKKLIML